MSPILFVVYLLYGIPSVLLYVIVIRCILQRRATIFAGSFYTIYLNTLYVNLATYLNTYINLKFRELPGVAMLYVGIEKYFVPYRVFLLFSFAFYHLQNTAAILMHFNRFTATIFPIYHQEIWKKATIPLIVGTTVYGIGASWPLLLVEDVYVYKNGEVARSAEFYTYLADMYIFIGTTGQVYMGLSIAFNVCTATKLVYLRFCGQRIAQSQEIGLFVMAFATFGCQLLCQIVITQISTAAAAYVSYSNIVSSVNADIFALSEVYIGLIFNKLLRQHVLKVIGYSKNVASTYPTTVTTVRSQTDASYRR